MEQLPNLAGGVLLLYGYEGGLLACVHAARRSLKCSCSPACRTGGARPRGGAMPAGLPPRGALLLPAAQRLPRLPGGRRGGKACPQRHRSGGGGGCAPHCTGPAEPGGAANPLAQEPAMCAVNPLAELAEPPLSPELTKSRSPTKSMTKSSTKSSTKSLTQSHWQSHRQSH